MSGIFNIPSELFLSEGPSLNSIEDEASSSEDLVAFMREQFPSTTSAVDREYSQNNSHSYADLVHRIYGRNNEASSGDRGMDFVSYAFPPIDALNTSHSIEFFGSENVSLSDSEEELPSYSDLIDSSSEEEELPSYAEATRGES